MANAPMTIFQVAGRAMSAQLLRMNTTASNLANAGGVAGSAEAAYKTMKPVFRTSFDAASGMSTVDVEKVVTAGEAPAKRYDPNNPMADKDGNIELAPVLFVDGDKITHDAKSLAKIKVTAEVVGDLRGPKINIQNYKNKTGYKRRMGHRSELTRVKITSIT